MDVLIRPARATEAGILTDLALRSKAHWGYDAQFLEACRDELTVAANEVTLRRATVADRVGHIPGFTTLEGEPPTGVLGMMLSIRRPSARGSAACCSNTPSPLDETRGSPSSR
jgi:hypothetical protein